MILSLRRTNSLGLSVTLAIALALSLSGCSMFGSSKKGDSKTGDGLAEGDLNAAREARFGSGSIPQAEGEGLFRDVHFDYDSYVVTDSARQDIEYNVEVLKSDSSIKVQVEGHCDERGTAEYNLALGNERARSVKEALTSYGINASRITTISYGEEVPLDAGHGEDSWAKNRRSHFSAFR